MTLGKLFSLSVKGGQWYWHSRRFERTNRDNVYQEQHLSHESYLMSWHKGGQKKRFFKELQQKTQKEVNVIKCREGNKKKTSVSSFRSSSVSISYDVKVVWLCEGRLQWDGERARWKQEAELGMVNRENNWGNEQGWHMLASQISVWYCCDPRMNWELKQSLGAELEKGNPARGTYCEVREKVEAGWGS